MYSDIFCKVYNTFGWNYYPEIFGQELLGWLLRNQVKPKKAIDLACGTGVLCRILHEAGIETAGMDLSEGMIAIARENDPYTYYEVADMTAFLPNTQYDLVTCTGDALNHIRSIADVEKVIQNVYRYTSRGGLFIFDLLNENEISTSEPFETDFDEQKRIWFQMTRPSRDSVNLEIRVFENNKLIAEENIGETLYTPDQIQYILRRAGFSQVICTDSLSDDLNSHGTTFFIIAHK